MHNTKNYLQLDHIHVTILIAKAKSPVKPTYTQEVWFPHSLFPHSLDSSGAPLLLQKLVLSRNFKFQSMVTMLAP